MNKKIYIIVIIISVVTLSIIAVFLLQKKQSANTVQENSGSLFGSTSGSNGILSGALDKKTSKATTTITQNNLPVLRKISNLPVAGAVSVIRTGGEGKTATSTNTYVRYIEKNTGNIYETEVDTGKTIRLSNTTIPGIANSMWSQDGESLVIRYIDSKENTVESFLARIKSGEQKRGSTEGVFLQNDINTITPSIGGNKVFYINSSSGKADAIITDFDGKNKKYITTLPINGWVSQYEIKNKRGVVFLTTKASGYAYGYMYKLDTVSGALRKVLGGIPGLTTLVNNFGNLVLYSQTGVGNISLYSYDINGKSSDFVPFSTLPEKCAWGEYKKSQIIYCGVPKTIDKSLFPDSWYQGVSSFSDDIWVYDTTTKNFGVLADINKLASVDIDIIKPFLDDTETHLFFINKKDSTLWVLNIKRD